MWPKNAHTNEITAIIFIDNQFLNARLRTWTPNEERGTITQQKALG